MASPTLGFRFGVLVGIIFAGVAVITLALTALFLTGLRAIPPSTLAAGVLMLITLFVAVALAVVLAGSLLAVGLLAFGVFVVAALVVAPPIGILAVLVFLVLLALVSAVVASPLNVAFGILLLLLLLIPVAALVVGILGPGAALVVIAVLGYIGLALAFAWLLLRVHRMPLELLGLGGLRQMPSIPLPTLPDFIDAVMKLKDKEAQEQIPIRALTNVFTLGAGTLHARTATARTFLFEDDEAKQYSLDSPAQFDMGWTTFGQVDVRAAALSATFAGALTTPAAGSALFWPNVSRYWGAFGILPIKVVTQADVPGFKSRVGPLWDDNVMGPLIQSMALFVIDMSVFASIDPPTASSPRFTPVTLAFLSLNAPTPLTPTFTPFLIQVSDGSNTQVYTTIPTGLVAPSAWLYALQALKASTTVWGIWLGHVYRYHMVTAAMQMTMYQGLPRRHGVAQVLGLQSKYVIGFDAVLLLDWTFPPPTSCATSIQFLQLTDAFAAGRAFFDDDPERTLAALGIPKTTFSSPLFRFQDINLPDFAGRLNAARANPLSTDSISLALLAALAPTTTALLIAYLGGEDALLQTALATDLNALIAGPSLAPLVTGTGIVLSPDTAAAVAAVTALAPPPPPGSPVLTSLNRMLLQDAYPIELWIMQFNLYPVAHYVVSIYRAAATYITAVVAALYPSNAAIIADARLQRWVLASATVGNVQGLPVPVTTTAQLTAVLTSLIYRITAHGLARLAPVGNPGLSWIGNFPPCLEDSRIPDPIVPSGNPPGLSPNLTPAQLLAFMPKAGTIGEMISFIFAFGYTPPFESLIPVTTANTSGGSDQELHPFVGLPAACDSALQTYRAAITGFIRFFLADQNALNAPAVMNFSATQAAIHQWEMNIEQ